MTWDTEQKRHTLVTFPGTYTHKEPQGCTIYIGDRMSDVKQKPDLVDTVEKYMNMIIQPVKRVLEDPSKRYTHFINILDQGKSIVKSLFAHTKRYVNVRPLPDLPDGQFYMPSGEGFLPMDWKGLTANRDLTKREVYYLFHRALIQTYTPWPGKCVVLDGAPDHPLTKSEFSENAKEELSKVYYTRTFEANPDQPVQMSTREVLATPVASGPLCVRGQASREEFQHNCAEGDLSAFYYVNKYFRHATNNGPHAVNHDVMLDTNDGDTVLIALMHARDRIDPTTSRFVNRVWVKLRGNAANRARFVEKLKTLKEEIEFLSSIDPEEYKGNVDKLTELTKRKDFPPGIKPEVCADPVKWRKEIDKKRKELKKKEEDPIDGRDIYININMLYISIKNHPALKQAQHPALMFVTLHILGGTDFFGDFSGDEYSLFFGMGWETCVWDTWCRYADRFSHMIMMFYSGETTFNQPELLRKTYLDEEAFLNFLYQCYATKYAAAIRANNPLSEEDEARGRTKLTITPKLLTRHTEAFALDIKRKPKEKDEAYEKRLKMAKKKRIPPKWILIRYIRLLVGNVTYWVNDYRPGGEKMFDPLETYNGLPYYGFEKDKEDPTGRRYTLSKVCSMSKPVPTHCVPHIGKNKRDDGRKKRSQDGEQEDARLMEERRKREEKSHARHRDQVARIEKMRLKKKKRLEQEREENAPVSIPSSSLPAFKKPREKVPAPAQKRDRTPGEEDDKGNPAIKKGKSKQ